MAKDYIPRPNAGFHQFQKNLVEMVVAKALAWNLPGGDVSTLATDSSTYANHFNIIGNKGNCTTSQRLAHDEFRTVYEKGLRLFVNGFLRGNKNISHDELSMMGIKVRCKKRKKRSAIDGQPVLWIVSQPGAFLKFYCRQEEHAGRASIHPEGDGVELRYNIGTPESNPNQMEHVLFSKKAHIRLSVKPEWRGKKIYACARWVNLSDQSRSSTWCDVVIQMIY
jgi:hypothetical protein